MDGHNLCCGNPDYSFVSEHEAKRATGHIVCIHVYLCANCGKSHQLIASQAKPMPAKKEK